MSPEVADFVAKVIDGFKTGGPPAAVEDQEAADRGTALIPESPVGRARGVVEENRDPDSPAAVCRGLSRAGDCRDRPAGDSTIERANRFTLQRRNPRANDYLAQARPRARAWSCARSPSHH